jgi:hypothetical protein
VGHRHDQEKPQGKSEGRFLDDVYNSVPEFHVVPPKNGHRLVRVSSLVYRRLKCRPGETLQSALYKSVAQMMFVDLPGEREYRQARHHDSAFITR